MTEQLDTIEEAIELNKGLIELVDKNNNQLNKLQKENGELKATLKVFVNGVEHIRNNDRNEDTKKLCNVLLKYK